MRKGLLTLIFLGLVLPLLVLAIAIKNPLTANTFEELIDNITTFFFNVALIIVPLIMVIAGAYFMFAGGDPKQVKNAKDLIYYAGIGFIIIFLAKGVIALLKQTVIK